MLPECVTCKQQRSDLRNIRGDLELEPLFLERHEEIFRISENDPILVCEDCIKNGIGEDMEEQQLGEFPQTTNTDQISLESDISGIEIRNESIPSGINSSTTSNMSDGRVISLDKLHDPREIQKLVGNDPVAFQNIKNILKKTMPASLKIRNIRQYIPAGLRNKVNLVPRQSNESNTSRRSAYEGLINISAERRYRGHDGSVRSLNSSQSSSISSGNQTILTPRIDPQLSSENILIPPSPVINRPPSQEAILDNLYDNEPSSNDSSRSSRRSQRLIDDGNAHSNSAAPRRISSPQINQLGSIEPPQTTRPQITRKTVGG